METSIISTVVVLVILLMYFWPAKKKPAPPPEPEPEPQSPFAFDIYTADNSLTGILEGFTMGNPFRGILVIGAAGSGKSVSVIRQLIANGVRKGYCGLLYDYKYPTLTNELNGYFVKSKNQLNSYHIKHYSINFTNVNKSVRINPLHPDYVPNASYAREYATAIINNLLPESIDSKDFWLRSCTDLLTAEIHYLAQECPQYSSLPHVIALNMVDETVLIPLLSKNLECMGMVKSLETGIRNNSKNQVSGVIATLQSALARLNNPQIFWLLSGNDISLELNNTANPIWLSIGNNSQLSDTYAPVISLITTVALKQMDKPQQWHSLVLLDEAPTIFIPNIQNVPATGRSNKIAFAFCAQDLSQIEKGYGKINMKNILNNCNNQFYGKVSSPETAEYVSRIFGKDDFETTSKSYSKTSSSNSDSRGESSTTSIRERDRVRPQQIMNFDVGEFACFLVESDQKDFISRLAETKAYNVETENRYSEIDFKGNFQLIHDQVKEILNPSEKTSNKESEWNISDDMLN